MTMPYADIGPYAISDVLGRGGMGVVYAGTHRETGARAAVKTVSATKAEKMFQIRREIETLAQLRHPGVVRILDYSVAGGRPWYAMDLLAGETLQRVCDGFWSAAARPPDRVSALSAALAETAALPSDVTAPTTAARRSPGSPPVAGPADQAFNGHRGAALGLIERICETLAYVHGEGVIHRDLKPSNIFVTSEGLPILVDFGLVSRAGAVTGREVLERTDVAGSARYMAPEQINGELVDPRTDLYALGCVIYELLTGHAPFEGTMAEVLGHHRWTVPRRPSELVDGVPPELDQAVMRLLAKTPMQRLAYARDLAACAARAGAQAPPWPGDVPRTRTYLCRPPLVGRHDMVEQIESAVRRLDQRTGALVLVAGESGVGKTRLALEVAWRAAARRCHVVPGGCEPMLGNASSGASLQGPPLHPFRPLLQGIADWCSEAGLEQTERVLGDRGPVLAAYEPALLDAPGQRERAPATPLPLAAARERLYRSLTETIAAHATRAATLLLLDDLQWADELTLGYLDYLVRGAIDGLPLVVLGTYRIEEKTAALGALSEQSGVLTVALSKLSPANVGEMVGGMLALRHPPRAFVSFLSSNSEGNPFFVTEYLRMAVAEQVIVRTPAGEWTFAETPDPTAVVCEALPLPRSLREVIERRLRILSPAARGAVDCATLMGRECDAATLQAALEATDTTMAAILGELVDRHVIEAADQADTFRFVHDKLREVAYAELSADERRDSHRRLALALESHLDRDRLEGQLGHHWSGADEPARAIPHLHRAGDRAHALYALRDAADLYRAALHDLARVPADDTADTAARTLEEAIVREKLAATLALTGAHEAARDEFERAIALLGPSRPVEVARVHRKIGKCLETLHDHPRALEAYACAEALLDGTQERDATWQAEWIQVHLNRIWVHYWQARITDMDAQLARVAPLVESHGLPLQRSSYYQAIVTRNYRQHRYVVSDETLEYARQSLAFATEAGARVEAGMARFVLGFGLLFHGDLEPAEAELYEALQETRRLGDVTSQIRCLAYLVIACRRAGTIWRRPPVCRRDAAARLCGQDARLCRRGSGRARLGGLAHRRRRRGPAALPGGPRLVGAAVLRHPFQWTGALTMLALQVSRAPLRQLVGLAEKMLDVHQMQLPEPIDRALHAAVDAYGAGDADATRDALQQAITEAKRLGFI